MSQQDRHLTTEQLSAFLDEQAEEQASLEEHLKSCAQCQLRLADLRQTVAFLHALPQPQASRSFLLPEDTPIHQARLHTSNDQASSTKRGTPARILAWPRAIRNTVRAVSVLAAVLGIVFLLSAFLPFSPGGITATSSGNSAAPGASYQQNRATAPATSAGNDSAAKPTQVAATATAHAALQATKGDQTTTQAEKTATAQATPPTQPTQPGQHQLTNQAPGLSTASGRLLWGFLLIILSLLGALLLRLQRKIAGM